MDVFDTPVSEVVPSIASDITARYTSLFDSVLTIGDVGLFVIAGVVVLFVLGCVLTNN